MSTPPKVRPTRDHSRPQHRCVPFPYLLFFSCAYFFSVKGMRCTKACSRCGLGFARSRPRMTASARFADASAPHPHPSAPVAPRISLHLKTRCRRLADDHRRWATPQNRTPQYLSPHVTRVARATLLFRTTRRPTRPCCI